MIYQILSFDTKLFGFSVAKIIPKKISLMKLSSILDALRLQGVRLVYWQSDSLDKKSQQAAQKLHGFLGSKQITYIADLKRKKSSIMTSEVEIYRSNLPTTEMKQLAIAIGVNSRFGVDPKVPQKLMEKMYLAWIKNSVNGKMADQVLVIKNKYRKIVGMIVLDAKGDRGNIKLLAVATPYRGKKFGTKLIIAAKKYFVKKDLSMLQVVTQQANISACQLYQNCGFIIESIDDFYHFWL
jgi:dTDP-4-amino-4,6-dideoxy-D-galactose acyltransferase